jgi:putative endonuclease
MAKNGFVYILGNDAPMLYIGVTNNLERRIWEHKNKAVPGFTSKFGIDRLLYFEAYDDIRDAIAREKQLKNWPA